MTERICVKVDSLRKKYNDPSITFIKWINMQNNVYVGRQGRIFINKKVVHYKGSVWENIYKQKEYGLEECLEKYSAYIQDCIKNNPIKYDIKTLVGKKLGCFCPIGQKCHVDILISLINQSQCDQHNQ